MRLHRFYTEEKIGSRKQFTIDSAELSNQLGRVFRLRKNDKVAIFDGSGSDYECCIDNLGGESKMIPKSIIGFSVVSVRPSKFIPLREVVLCASIVKKDNFEWICEKATELGVTKIIPIVSERSEKKLINEARLNKIAIEASEQSGRGNIPAILPTMSLDKSIDYINERVLSTLGKPVFLAFHTSGDVISSVGNIKTTGPMVVFIGPEGGWSNQEISMFHAKQVPIVCLGSQTLRTETAVISALTKVLL